MFDLEQPAVFYGGTRMTPRHRVWLRRKLRAGTFRPAVFALHNPSIAGREKNDPTATRGINFALSWGCTDLVFVNAATQIATDARHLDPADLNCPWSDWALVEAARLATENGGYLIAAWGAPKGLAPVRRLIETRYTEMRKMLGNRLHCLRVTENGYPSHPLYLPSTLTPEPYA